MTFENAIQPLISRVCDGEALNTDQAGRAFQIIMNGGATPAQISAFLVGLRMKGETPEEITGAAEAVRAKAAPFHSTPGTIDTCGTGGDGAHTLNISTAVALVLAGAGVPVAKHGNRAVSSKSGSADVLEMLGVKIDAPAHVMERCLQHHHFAFLFAPLYHKAMRHVAPIRQELGMRTIFNLIGPLANPAKPEFQLLGVYSPALVMPMAEVLRALGVRSALVVHGAGGLDEISLSGPTIAAELKGGEITPVEITPEDAGIARSDSPLKGGDAGHNAEAIRRLLAGEKSAYRDAVMLNAAAALVIAERAENLREGAEIAKKSLDDGNAFTTLQHIVEASRHD